MKYAGLIAAVLCMVSAVAIAQDIYVGAPKPAARAKLEVVPPPLTPSVGAVSPNPSATVSPSDTVGAEEPMVAPPMAGSHTGGPDPMPPAGAQPMPRGGLQPVPPETQPPVVGGEANPGMGMPEGVPGVAGGSPGYPGDDYKPEPEPKPVQNVACKPDGYIGRRVLREGEAKSAGGNEIDVREFKQPFRVLFPGSPATMDYSEQRLNLIIDPATRIVKEAHCG